MKLMIARSKYAGKHPEHSLKSMPKHAFDHPCLPQELRGALTAVQAYTRNQSAVTKKRGGRTISSKGKAKRRPKELTSIDGSGGRHEGELSATKTPRLFSRYARPLLFAVPRPVQLEKTCLAQRLTHEGSDNEAVKCAKRKIEPGASIGPQW